MHCTGSRNTSVLWHAAGLALAALAGVAGCAHHVGYADIRIEAHPAPGARQSAPEARSLILVTHHPTAQEPILRAKLYRRTVVRRPVRQEFSGRPIMAPYHWAMPFLKPFVPVTIVLGVVMPLRQPHDHKADLWGWGDYCRDFWGWVNPFEAFPSAGRKLRAERVVFRSRRGWEAAGRSQVPLERRRVELRLGERAAGSYATDAQGEVSVDLRAVGAKPSAGEAPVVLTLEAKGARRRVVLSSDVASALGWR